MWNQYLCQNLECPTRTIEGQAIVVSVHDSKLHTLNETASFLWDLAENGKQTLAEIKDSMINEFDVDAETASSDIEFFVKDGLEKGLLILRATV